MVKKKYFRLFHSVLAVVGVVVLGYVIISARASAVTGDLNGDGQVNVFDLSILLSAWGTSNTLDDLNHDGQVNVFDLSTLLSHWGQTAPTPTTAPSEGLWVNPNTDASAQAAAWAASNPSGAAEMQKIAAEPTSAWFGNWNSNVQADVANYVNAAAAAHGIPVIVAYNIPNRDCGGYSAGGATDATYPGWITQFANGIGSNPAIVVLEPDALASTSCLSSAEYQIRMKLLANAVTTLKSHAGAKVYIDAGNPGWLAAGDAANRLGQANIAGADGFSLNVSNFFTTAQNVSYGQQISSLAGNKHFVIDTSRNGLGSDGQWCNPPGRALGGKPSLATGVNLVDAYLWVKYPGESDGTCNGGPAAGIWWPDYALGLAERAAF